MILAHAGNRLFTVYVDHRDLNRLAKLWKLVDRIEKLNYTTRLGQLAMFLSSLGPAPNLKVLYLRPESTAGIEEPASLVHFPTIFSGCLPSLHDLILTSAIAWPIGLFKDLISFECGVSGHRPISATHALGVLRESPSIESIRLVGYSTLPRGFHTPAITLPSLKRCALVGRGTTSLIRFLTVPASTYIFLGKPYAHDWSIFPKFDHVSVEPNLPFLDEVSAISFSISDYVVRLKAKNVHGGVWDAQVDELDKLSLDPIVFLHFIRSSFECTRTCPGFKTAETFTLEADLGRTWEAEEATCFALDVVGLISNLPDIKEVALRGIPSTELSSILEFLHCVANYELPCPNLRRLHIVSAPIRSPRPLLEGLGELLAEREKAGAAFQSVTVKVKCELLIPAPEHRAFLTSWAGLVGEGVSLEYEETEVKKLPRHCRRNYEWDYEGDDWDSEDEGYEDGDEGGEGDEENEEGGTGDPDGGCVGWNGWPENWPATVDGQ